MRKKNISPNAQTYPRTIQTLTEDDFRISFNNNSNYGTVPLAWIELVSTFHRLEIEIEEWSKLNEENRKTVEIYRQKCKASVIAGFKDDPRLIWEFYKEEYGHEISLNEKLEELEGIDDEEEEDNK